MVRTRGSQGRGASSQALPTLPAPPPPSPELAFILRSLEAINETLKGRQPAGIEVEPPPSRMGNPEVSRDSGGGPPPEDITRELQKIKILEFSRGRTSERVETWLEGMTRCFALRDYAVQIKGKDCHFSVKGQRLELVGQPGKTTAPYPRHNILGTFRGEVSKEISTSILRGTIGRGISCLSIGKQNCRRI
jgi:hypothetical protein